MNAFVEDIAAQERAIAHQLLDTGLFGTLADCSDVEDDDEPRACPNSRHWKPKENADEDDDESGFPKPLRSTITTGNLKKSRLLSYKRDAAKLFPSFDYVQSTAFHLDDARRSTKGFIGDSKQVDKTAPIFPKGSTSSEQLRILEAHNYKKIQSSDAPILILDKACVCIGVAVPPHPNPDVQKEMVKDFEEVMAFSQAASITSRRGDFNIVEMGFQQGPGFEHPGLRAESKMNSQSSRAFFGQPAVQEMMHRVKCVFIKYFPDLFEMYDSAMESACALNPDLGYEVKDLPFACYTLNVGTRCICKIHVDGLNLCCGLCCVIPLGSYNHKEGGHLILHELRMVLEVPPGSIVLFPSAIISHQNVEIQHGETRKAFTAFTPGSTFRWITNGFKNAPKMIPSAAKVYGEAVWRAAKARLPHILSQYSTHLGKSS